LCPSNVVSSRARCSLHRYGAQTSVTAIPTDTTTVYVCVRLKHQLGEWMGGIHRHDGTSNGKGSIYIYIYYMVVLPSLNVILGGGGGRGGGRLLATLRESFAGTHPQQCRYICRCIISLLTMHAGRLFTST